MDKYLPATERTGSLPLARVQSMVWVTPTLNYNRKLIGLRNSGDISEETRRISYELEGC